MERYSGEADTKDKLRVQISFSSYNTTYIQIIPVHWTPIFRNSHLLGLQYKILIGISSGHVVTLKPAFM